jgi:CRP-like cAMP-binding protein
MVPLQRIEAAFAEDPDLARAWPRHLAQEVQRARAQAEILSLKTVAERVDAWITLNDGALPPMGYWHQVASDGITPEALYRELARRR